MKVIFLDIDGVLCSFRTYHFLDVYATSFLINLCENKNIKIVISSSWRKNKNAEVFFKNIFKDILHKNWKTPILDREQSNGLWTSVSRGTEIQKWLDNNNVSEYLILDDDIDILESQKNNYIKIDTLNGIIYDDMVKILKYFNIMNNIKFDNCLKIEPNINYLKMSK